MKQWRSDCRQNIEVDFGHFNDDVCIAVASDAKTIAVRVLPPVVQFRLPDKSEQPVSAIEGETVGHALASFRDVRYIAFDDHGKEIPPEAELADWSDVGHINLHIVYPFKCDYLEEEISRLAAPEAILAGVVEECLGKPSAGCTVMYDGEECDLTSPMSNIRFHGGGAIRISHQYPISFRSGDRRVRLTLDARVSVRDIAADSFPELKGDLEFALGGNALAPETLLYSRCSIDDEVNVTEGVSRRCEFKELEGDDEVMIHQVELTAKVRDVARRVSGCSAYLFLNGSKKRLPSDAVFVDCVPRGALVHFAPKSRNRAHGNAPENPPRTHQPKKRVAEEPKDPTNLQRQVEQLTDGFQTLTRQVEILTAQLAANQRTIALLTAHIERLNGGPLEGM
jgi:hypothetical protein